MIDHRDQRVRDPVHGLIVFRSDDPLAQLAWRLLSAPEMQRLRRIRQLGVSEFVFPGATHTRFAHSVGVFHTARLLIKIIEREMERKGEIFDRGRADTVALAALLHDVGHGPFSHAFEGVQAGRGAKKKHEAWSAAAIRCDAGGIKPLLEARRPGLAEEIAILLEQEDPADIYHAIVSSSFDADRLDYLRRDRMMTGTQAGAIDFDWLMEHVRVELVEIDADEGGDEPTRVPTFCLDRKALPAAEQFLLSRYTLHEQVYFHKATRCIEKMIARLLGKIADHADAEDVVSQTGLPADHPLIRFFASHGETLTNYLALDDLAVWGSMDGMRRALDPVISDIAARLLDRRLYKTLDMGFIGSDSGRQTKRVRWIDANFATELRDGNVIKDEGAKVSIYTQIGGDDDRTHKKLHVVDGGRPVEVSSLSDMVNALATPRLFTRYYFEDESWREEARQAKRRAE